MVSLYGPSMWFFYMVVSLYGFSLYMVSLYAVSIWLFLYMVSLYGVSIWMFLYMVSLYGVNVLLGCRPLSHWGAVRQMLGRSPPLLVKQFLKQRLTLRTILAIPEWSLLMLPAPFEPWLFWFQSHPPVNSSLWSCLLDLICGIHGHPSNPSFNDIH